MYDWSVIGSILISNTIFSLKAHLVILKSDGQLFSVRGRQDGCILCHSLSPLLIRTNPHTKHDVISLSVLDTVSWP